MTDLSADIAALPDKSLLVLDDDAPLRTRLGRALEQRGFEPILVGSVGEAMNLRSEKSSSSSTVLVWWSMAAKASDSKMRAAAGMVVATPVEGFARYSGTP